MKLTICAPGRGRSKANCGAEMSQNFDWGGLAEQVIGLGAPVLGGALGGPLGAAAGKILADTLGVAESSPRRSARRWPHKRPTPTLRRKPRRRRKASG